MLSGRKTYIVGVLMIVLGVLQGDKEMIMQGLVACFLRAGISKM